MLAPRLPPTWLGLCPGPTRTHPVLLGVEAHLGRDDVAEALAEGDRLGRYPREILDALWALGVRDLLGEKASAPPLGALAALLARHDGSLAITVLVNALALLPVWLAGSPEQRARVLGRVHAGARASLLLTEWDHGSDLLANRLRATPAPGGYRLDGEKHVINGGREHDLLVVLARTRDGVPGATALEAAGDFSVFVVDRRAGVTPLPRHATLPAHAADISGVRFSAAFAAYDERLGAEGDGFSVIQQTLAISRGGVSALASGSATRAVELATMHADTRILYGAPIAQLGPVAAHCARARALDLAAAALSVKQSLLVGALGQGAAYYTACAKLAGTALGEDAVTEARMVLSGRALVAGPAERLVRDVLLYGIFDGTSHVMAAQVHARLAQALGDGPADLGALAAALAAGATCPPLSECARKRARPLVQPLASRADALGAPGLAAYARQLGALHRATTRDDTARLDALARATAELEAAVAVAELATPEGRSALGLPSLDQELPAAAEVALHILSARLAGRLATLAAC